MADLQPQRHPLSPLLCRHPDNTPGVGERRPREAPALSSSPAIRTRAPTESVSVRSGATASAEANTSSRRALSRGTGGPAGGVVVDVMDRVEEQNVLHIGEDLHHRTAGLAGRQRLVGGPELLLDR